MAQKLTKTQRFVLRQLDTPGRVPEPKRRYTLSLRIMEERGLVGRTMNDQWYIKLAGKAALNDLMG